MSIFLVFLTTLVSILFAGNNPAVAQDKPRFIFPVACALGQNCWPANFVDVNPQEDIAEDFTCGPRSYDGHKGTDFALKDREVMRSGVAVLAAKDGTVERLRDGEDDTPKSETQIAALKADRKECGNGVFIDHGAAVKTIYCHMKKGSITVKVGDKVTAGDKIGEIGQSGMAEFPHLHFGIVWENGVIDPYTGMSNQDGCGLNKGSLWADVDAMGYEQFSIYDGGFRAAMPKFKAIEEGEKSPETLPLHAEALVLWGAFYGIREGDRINLTITDPLGRVFANQDITQDKTRARQYYYTGRTLAGKTMPPGQYTGTINVIRAGVKEESKVFTVELL